MFPTRHQLAGRREAALQKFRQFARWLAAADCLADRAQDPTGHACLEATGRYSLGIALALHEAGHVVSLVNPAQIRDFARTKLGRNKTDQVDAAHIREYAELFKPSPGPHLRRPCGGCANSRRSGPARSPA